MYYLNLHATQDLVWLFKVGFTLADEQSGWQEECVCVFLGVDRWVGGYT